MHNVTDSNNDARQLQIISDLKETNQNDFLSWNLAADRVEIKTDHPLQIII